MAVVMDLGDFRRMLANSNNYPRTVIVHEEPGSSIESYVRHFKEQEKLLFDKFTGKNTCLSIRDYGGETPGGHLQLNPDVDDFGQVDDVTFRCLFLPDISELKSRLSWHHDDEHGRHHLQKDPKCRFILFEALGSESQLLLLTKEMIFLVLTYHQVSPCYLNFIASLASSTSATDLGFGGFRAQSFLRTQGPGIAPLGRSGRRYQLSFRLQSIQEHDWDHKEMKWRKQNAAIYHCFDVREGRSLWILTSPRELTRMNEAKNYLWENVKASIRNGGHGQKLIAEDSQTRFAGTLAVVVSLAEWALGDFSYYLHHLENKLTELMTPYLYPINTTDDPELITVAKDLRGVTKVISHLQDCIIKLRDNIRVLKSLQKFYSQELIAELKDAKIEQEWIDNAKANTKQTRESLQRIINNASDILKRAETLNRLAKSREALIDKLLQTVQNARMKKISEVALADSSAMKNLSLITFLLLPFTVVSTVLSTDIVSFANASREANQGSGPTSGPAPPYTFSATAFGTWIVASTILGMLIFALSYLVERRAYSKHAVLEDSDTEPTPVDGDRSDDPSVPPESWQGDSHRPSAASSPVTQRRSTNKLSPKTTPTTLVATPGTATSSGAATTAPPSPLAQRNGLAIHAGPSTPPPPLTVATGPPTTPATRASPLTGSPRPGRRWLPWRTDNSQDVEIEKALPGALPSGPGT